MARYKPQEHNSLLLPVVLSEQIIPGSFVFALNDLVDHELDLKPLDTKFKNDETEASAYAKVNAQWNLYCMVHNIEKLSKTELGRNIQ